MSSTLTFDSARGLTIAADDLGGDGGGATYRIVEQNPTRTIVLEIEDSAGPDGSFIRCNGGERRRR